MEQDNTLLLHTTNRKLLYGLSNSAISDDFE